MDENKTENGVENGGGSGGGGEAGGPRKRTVFTVILILLIAAAAAYLGRGAAKSILKPADGGKSAHEGHDMASHEGGAAKKELYQCPMHPSYTSDKPGDCPICGMKLVKVDTNAAEEMKDMPKGTVMLTPEKQQLIGVQTGKVGSVTFERTLRANGIVEYDERRLHHVTTKVEGWTEKLYVNYMGDFVKKGQPLFKIYSPELVSTQEEYLLAYRNRNRLENSTLNEVRAAAQSLLDASRRRLQLWDVTDAQIENLERTGETTKTLTIYSPASGIVTEKMIYEGHRIMAGEPLFTIADISSVWILADIYEYEMPYLRVGQTALVRPSYLPGQTFSGKITYIYPYLEKETRTLKVRLEFANRGLAFKPGMYVEAEIMVNLGTKLAVPEEAVLDSGTAKTVFLDRGEGHFEPREIQTGVRTEDYYEVLEGLSEGDRVVTSANFLMDSESRMKSAVEGMEHQH